MTSLGWFLQVMKELGREQETLHNWPHSLVQKPQEYIKLINTLVAFYLRKAGSILARQAVDG